MRRERKVWPEKGEGAEGAGEGGGTEGDGKREFGGVVSYSILHGQSGCHRWEANMLTMDGKPGKGVGSGWFTP